MVVVVICSVIGSILALNSIQEIIGMIKDYMEYKSKSQLNIDMKCLNDLEVLEFLNERGYLKLSK